MDPRIQLASLTDTGDAARVLRILDAHRVIVSAPPGRCTATADQAALFNAVNLLSRIFAHVELRIDEAAPSALALLAGATLGEGLRTLIGRRPTEPACDATTELHMAWGAPPPGTGVAADAHDWTYSYGTRHLPLAERGSSVAVGALVATSLAVGQLFGRALARLGVSWHEVDGIVANLLDYRHTVAPAEAPAGPLGPALMAGTGSVGSSMIYAALLAGIGGGPIDLIDPDAFSSRNRLRYPILLDDALGPKVDLLAALAAGTDLDLRPHCTDVHGYLATLPTPPALPLVLSSVDTREGRLDATDLLAGTTISAGVAGLQLHVAVHGFGGDHACAFCQYVDAEPALSATALLAEAIGLPVERLIAIRHRGGRLDGDDAQAVVVAGRVGGGVTAGDRLEDLYRRAYAQATIPGGAPLQVSAPQVSALAGVLMLVEGIKHALPELAPYRLRERFDVDTSGQPPDFVLPVRRDTSRRCICWSSFRQDAYHRLHAA